MKNMITRTLKRKAAFGLMLLGIMIVILSACGTTKENTNKNGTQFNYTNNWSGVVQYFIIQNWDDLGSQWFNSSKQTFTYFPYAAGVAELTVQQKQLIKIYDLMGSETEYKPNTPLIFIYSDGTIERVMKLEE